MVLIQHWVCMRKSLPWLICQKNTEILSWSVCYFSPLFVIRAGSLTPCATVVGRGQKGIRYKLQLCWSWRVHCCGLAVSCPLDTIHPVQTDRERYTNALLASPFSLIPSSTSGVGRVPKHIPASGKVVQEIPHWGLFITELDMLLLDIGGTLISLGRLKLDV